MLKVYQKVKQILQNGESDYIIMSYIHGKKVVEKGLILRGKYENKTLSI